ncbi:hypothetical protein [Candidatus Halocynthiibacter alkanivorans]|uniref:hypothetical protein n=1 Tax=Candidatus Halocynthiibacter alkanivorans TaxID=2267619 RepID=UPI00109CCF3F|nr:hypothetical protein [Candidatus Halocynthiibacter alkanivorans]
MLRLVLASFLFLPSMAHSVTYDCTVSSKVWKDGSYSKAQIRDGQCSVKIDDRGSNATLSRCSFARSEGRITCDEYEADYIDQDPNVGVKKFYYFGGQFDIQLFASTFFVENNGRGTIANGTCRVIRP